MAITDKEIRQIEPFVMEWIERYRAGGFSSVSGSNGGSSSFHHPFATGRNEADQHSMAAISGLVEDLAAVLRYDGEWVSTKTYPANRLVFDGEWCGISLVDTFDRLAPVSLRQPAYDMPADTDPSWSTGQLTVGVLYAGHDYTITQSGWVSGVRANIPAASADLVYQLIYIADPDGLAEITYGEEFTASSTGWNYLRFSQRIFTEGFKFRLLLSVRNTSSSSTWNAQWRYTTPNNNGTPATGDIIHSDKEKESFRIHKTDNGGTDRSSQLSGIGVGDNVEVGGTLWTIQELTDNGTWIEYIVSPQIQYSPDGVQTVTFTDYGISPVDYAYIPNHWNTDSTDWATVESVSWGDQGTPTISDHGMPVDLEFTPAYVSPDWKIFHAGLPGQSAGGGDGGGGDTHSPVSSPLETINVGSDQEIDVNQAFDFNLMGDVTFTNDIDAPGIDHAGNFTITLDSGDLITDELIRSSNYVSGSAGGQIDLFGNTTTELDSLRVRDNSQFDSNLTISGNALVGGYLDVDLIVAADGLTLSPAGDLMLYPFGDTLMDGIQKYKDFDSEGPGVFVDWSGDLGSKFDALEVNELIVQQFSVHNAEVSVGQHIVGKSASQSTRPFSIPGCADDTDFEFVNGSDFELLNGNTFDMLGVKGAGVIYIKNVPGVGDMAAFASGDDLAFRYYCDSGGNPPNIAVVENSWTGYIYETGSSGYGATIEDENFDSVPIGDEPNGWTPTGPDNSMATDSNAWGAYDNSNINSTRMMQTTGSIGNDANVHMHYTGSGYGTLTDYVYEGRFYAAAYATGVGLTLLSDYPNTDTYIRIRSYNGMTMHVANHGYAAPDGGITDSGYAPPTKVWVQFKIEVENDTTASKTYLRAKFWNTSEPATWQIDCHWDGTSRPTEGTFGLWGYQSSGGAYAVYDDILVRELGSEYQAPSLDFDIPLTDQTTLLSAVSIITFPIGETAPTLTVPSGWDEEEFTALPYATADPDGRYAVVYVHSKTVSGGGTDSTTWASSGGGLGTTIVAHANTIGNMYINLSKSHLGETWTGSDPLTDSDTVHEFELSFAHPGTVTVSGATHAVAGGIGGEIVLRYNKFPNRGIDKTVLTYEYSALNGGLTLHAYATAQTGQGDWAQFGLGYAKVVQRVFPSDLESDEQAWIIEMTKGPDCPCTLPSDTGIFDLGVSGDSFWIADAIDPLSGGAYDAVIQRGDDPWDWTSKIRTGYLGGTQAAGSLGLYYKEGYSLVELSEERAFFENVQMQWNSSGFQVGYISDSIGFGAFEDPWGNIDEAPRGFTLLALDNSVLGGAYGDHDSATDTGIVRLEATYQYGIDNTSAQVEASADDGNTAEALMVAYRGPYWTKDEVASVTSYIDEDDLPSVTLMADSPNGTATLTVYEDATNQLRVDADAEVIDLTSKNPGGTALSELLAENDSGGKKAGMSATATLTSELTSLYGQVAMYDLPTSEPGSTGYLWNDGGTLKIT